MLAVAIGCAAPPHARAADEVTRAVGISLMGKPALPPDFKNFPYVNPDAPKGGEITLGAVGTFDSFNPFIVRGTAPTDISRVWDTLTRANADEAEAGYGHLAEWIEVPADNTWVAFVLRPQARFSDGKPVTAEDVAWTFDTLREHGKPFYRQYYADVKDVATDGPRRVVFHFKSGGNRELPMILGQMPVLPKHWFAGRDFTRPLTDKPVGSGAYEVDSYEFGRTLTLSRVRDWWAKDLPTARGLDNFDRRRTEYFRDSTAVSYTHLTLPTN